MLYCHVHLIIYYLYRGSNRGQIKKGENVQNLFLFIHATKYVSLNILKIYPQLMLRNKIFLL